MNVSMKTCLDCGSVWCIGWRRLTWMGWALYWWLIGDNLGVKLFRQHGKTQY